MNRKSHPSGRPIHRPERRGYSMAAQPTIGFRCPRLNPQHIEQATDSHSIGFVDWRVHESIRELELRNRGGKA